MKKYIPYIIITILLVIIAIGGTYIFMDNQNKNEIPKIDNTPNIDNKENIEEKESEPIDGIKLLRTYQENDKIFQEYEIILNGNKKALSIAYTYKEQSNGEKNLLGTSSYNLLFCDYNFFGTSITKSSIFNTETIKKYFNEDNFQLIKGQDGKNYLTVWTCSDFKEYLYIFNENLELLTDDSFEDEIDESASKNGMSALSDTFIPIVEGTNPSYEYKYKKDSNWNEETVRINVKIEQNNIHYLVLVNPLYKANASAYDQTILEERVYQINNNKLTYKVIHTYPAEFANATY